MRGGICMYVAMYVRMYVCIYDVCMYCSVIIISERQLDSSIVAS